jgi:sugar phosphate isomerase/epimerase
MVPALLAHPSPLLSRHLTIGCSTGYMEENRGNWPALVEEAAATSSLAAELTALSEDELPELIAYLDKAPRLPFHYVSVHAPSKERKTDDAGLVEMLLKLPSWVDAIVIHPDIISDIGPYERLGRVLVVENMDSRKESGRTAAELAPIFDALPQAGFCFDVAHAHDIDATLGIGSELLDRFAGRLRHVHLSSLDEDKHHASLTSEDLAAYEVLLDRCRDVPWILEAPPRPF